MRALRVPGAGAVLIRFRETGYRFCYSAVQEAEHKIGPRFGPEVRGGAAVDRFGRRIPECVRAASGRGGHRKVARQYTPGAGIYVTVVT